MRANLYETDQTEWLRKSILQGVYAIVGLSHSNSPQFSCLLIIQNI